MLLADIVAVKPDHRVAEYAIELDKGSRVLLFLVPRSQCPGWLPTLNVLSGRALQAAGPAHIAAACLSAMLRDVVPLDSESEGTLHESIVALIERALAIELGARGLEARAACTQRCPLEGVERSDACQRAVNCRPARASLCLGWRWRC